mmetsp:Transcript_21850/g.72227  ORF Transcript_21850/g.72227 Transcript_21850/m.72227 type:complete len:331 (-) Transcript_21850:458-1450(-)
MCLRGDVNRPVRAAIGRLPIHRVSTWLEEMRVHHFAIMLQQRRDTAAIRGFVPSCTKLALVAELLRLFLLDVVGVCRKIFEDGGDDQRICLHEVLCHLGVDSVHVDVEHLIAINDLPAAVRGLSADEISNKEVPVIGAERAHDEGPSSRKILVKEVNFLVEGCMREALLFREQEVLAGVLEPADLEAYVSAGLHDGWKSLQQQGGATSQDDHSVVIDEEGGLGDQVSVKLLLGIRQKDSSIEDGHNVRPELSVVLTEASVNVDGVSISTINGPEVNLHFLLGPFEAEQLVGLDDLGHVVELGWHVSLRGRKGFSKNNGNERSIKKPPNLC